MSHAAALCARFWPLHGPMNGLLQQLVLPLALRPLMLPLAPGRLAPPLALGRVVLSLALAPIVLLSAPSLAQVQPLVEVTVTPETVRVGEALELQVTVLVPTWFARPPEYPDFELANTITQRPPDSSFPTSRRVDGENWSGIVRSFRIYPLQAANYRIDAAHLGVTYANPGGTPVSLQVPIPAIRFHATVPAGAETLTPYLAGSALRLSLAVEGDTGSLQVGEAVTLEYRAEVDGMPAIFIPPLAPALTFDSASVYAGRPTTADGPPAVRSEKLTVVFAGGGDFSVPPVTLRYWNTQSATVESATAEGVTLRVEGPAASLNSATQARSAPAWPLLAGLAFSGVIALALLRLAWRYWRRSAQPRLRAARERHLRSEAYAFKALQQSLQAGDRSMAYRALLTWTEHLTPAMTSREFAQRYGGAELAGAIDALAGGLFGASEHAAAAPQLAQHLQVARVRYLREQRGRAKNALPELNP